MKTILVDGIDAFFIEGQGVNEEMHALLEKFSNPKIILTNATQQTMQSIGMTGMPYPVFSLEHKVEKTDPRYYQQMLQRFGLTADEVVYFEHNEDAVKAARSVGITSYHYDEQKKDISALQQFLSSKG